MRGRIAGDRSLAFVVVSMIGVAAVWVGQTRVARQEEPPAHHTSAYQADPDAQFLEDAAQAGLAGALIGKLAERKGGEPVRRLARNVSDDFRWFNTELAQLASGRGVSIPLKLNAEKMAAYESLAAVDGAEFDRLWASSTLEMHDAAASALRAEASEGSYPEIKRFAARNLPEVEHRKVAIEDAISRAGLAISVPGIE